MSTARTYKATISTFSALIYIAGIVLAKGFWSTFFAVFIPPWGWYLLVEHSLRTLGWIA